MLRNLAPRLLAILLLLAMALLSFDAHAVDSPNILDDVLIRFSKNVGFWEKVIKERASWLFWLLATISMVWTFGLMALRKADLGEFFAEFFRFTAFTGFFYWLLDNGPRFAVSIIASLRKIASEASGLPNILSPSGIVDAGFVIFYKVVDQLASLGLADAIASAIIAAIILVVFALVGINMLLLLVSAWILAYAGIFFLGFGGSRWTSDMAIGYFKTVLNIAAQLFSMVLLVGIGISFVDDSIKALAVSVRLKELGAMLVVAVVLLLLVTRIPPLIGGLAGGNAGALGGGFGMGALAGAATLGATAAASAASAMVSGGAALAGGAQAVMAAFSKASASESSGGGTAALTSAAANGAAGRDGGGSRGGSALATAMGDSESSMAGSSASRSPSYGGTSDSGSAGSSAEGDSKKAADSGDGTGANSSGGGAPGSGKPGSATSAAGAIAAKVGKVAVGTAVNLVQGSWDVAKAKASDMKDTAMDRIGETTGGKIAAAIKGSGVGKKTGGDVAQFGEDSLSPGSTAVDAVAEIAAFRDRNSKPS